MIYITGDTHIPIDIHKLSMKEFPEQKEMTKNDYVIICGDCGICWNNSEEEMFWRKWLNERNFTTLFVDGNHENFSMLNAYHVEQWQGGNVHMIGESIIHLMRGQVFNIDGLKFFTMGGASSVDKQFRKVNVSWWAEEEPSKQELQTALDNLEKHNWEVDYVITHTCSREMMLALCYVKEDNCLNGFFSNMIEPDLKYKHWYFGHFHWDKQLDEKHTLLYNTVVKL
jgi:predicted phosphodiesterase